MEEPARLAQAMVEAVSQVLEGKTDVIQLAIVALLARGHLLVEDVPGVGKTTLARSIAHTVGVSFGRIQFTSDLMPVDVLGGSVFDQRSGTFEFRPGPIFTKVLLADEINRTTPKTQSALLEAMGERQVSIEGVTRTLEEPFFVVATQNPEEFYGTYPLPESQLDRFLLTIRVGYPPRDVERRLLRTRRGGDPTERLSPVADQAGLLQAQAAVDEVRVDDAVLDYLHAVVLATRDAAEIELGVSTRGALAYERAVRARALVMGRGYATPDDVKVLAVPVLAHRLRLRGTESRTIEAERAIEALLERIEVPV